MPTHRETLLCRYHYDPLDRLADCTPTAQASSQRFYLKDRLATEIQGARQRSILQHEDQLLAQQQRQSDTVETHLLATDQQRSVLAILDATRPHHLAYTPYGHCIPENGLLSLLGFNGERPDPVTGHYLLGNGYRAFNPVLMRFNSPDSWSPFGEGGVNAYAYCVGDPVNHGDKTGHLPKFMLRLLGGSKTPSGYSPLPTNNSNLTSASTTAARSEGVGTNLNTAGTSNPLLPRKNVKTIKALEGKISRNKDKLEHVDQKLNDLNTNKEKIVSQIMRGYSDFLLPAEEYEWLVRANIAKKIAQLELKHSHYTTKIPKLTQQLSEVRQQ